MDKIETFYPLSPMQQGLLFHALYEPDSVAYSYQLSCSLHGKLNVTALERAWRRVMERHAILRTGFVWKDLKEPVQVVHKDVQLPLEQHDWRALPHAEQQARLSALLQTATPLDPAQVPLMRLYLIRLAEDVHQFIWRYHHILLDGWSTSIVLTEVFTLYEALARGEELELPPSRPYRDHIVWLRRQNLNEAETFWRRTLKGFNAPTRLSIDRAPAGTASDRDARVESYEDQQVVLSEELTEGLRALARQQQLTVNTLVQAAWALLLSYYGDSEEVVFGTTVSGRPVSLPGVETIVGLFINTLPLRVKIEPERPLLSWLKDLLRAQLEQREYEYSPLVQVQGWSEVPRGLPLFESILVFENYPLEKSMRERAGSSIEVRGVNALEWSHYPLVVIALPGRELSLHITYDTSRFEAPAVKRLLEQLRTLLAGMVAAPEQALGELNPLCETERRQLLYDWNETRNAYPRDKCIHQLFEEQVERSPQAVALVSGERQVSYEELNRRANQLAHYLRAHGVGAEVPVALMLDRSIELIVCLLAILKAGGSYVPLDPAYPLERLTFMLEDVGVPLLLTEERWLDVLPTTHALVICLDTDWPDIERESVENPRVQLSADNQAYIMYTSGSTGRPKGVSALHRGVVRLVKETAYANFDAGEVFLQFAPVSFDASTFEIWGSLLNGARLVLMPPGPASLEELGQALERYGVTTLWLTAGLFHAMVDAELPRLKSLRQMLAGGDVLSLTHVRKFLRESNEGCALVNGYGPTETTTFACCYRMNAPLATSEQTVPIGWPIANTDVYLLNERMQPVPLGAAGELYIGGDGLARGYLNRPDATAEKFVPHPFSREPGARLYKTGDLVRRLEDGRIEFIGRRDEQVKVRGFRVELGEIKATLEQFELVREAVVLVDRDARGNQRLVAYVVAATFDGDASQAELPGKLRSYLQEKLPDYMIPAAFLLLDELPLTANGKIDRRALPAPEIVSTHPGDEGALAANAPRTPVEEMLVGIWSEVLGVEHLGTDADFFELGGHSLLATQVVSRVRQTFRVELPLRTIFEATTPARLALVLESALRAATEQEEIPPIVPVSRDAALPLSFAQQRLWFLDQLEPGSAAYNIPSAVRLKGQLNVEALTQSLNEVVRRHEALRTTFGTREGQPVQVIREAGEFNLPLIDLSELSEEAREAEAQLLAEAEAAKPFDLSTGPLLRATLLRLSEEDHIALLTMHHIVSDGWSAGILIREVAALYEVFSRGESSPLEALPIQYADYAVWQREWLQGEVLETQLSYWRKHLSGAPAYLDLPTDHPRPAVQSFRGAYESFSLSPQLSAQLYALSRREGATLFMTLLAAFKLLLSRYSGQSDIVVGTPVANRNRVETEALIGFFVNTLVLRTEVASEATFTRLLARVREAALSAYAHQDVPFERLVEELQPERDMSHTPLFQVMFVLQNAPRERLELSGLRLEGLASGAGTAKFDLTLGLEVGESGEIGGTLEYNRELYEGETVRRMLRHYERVLEQVVREPELSVNEVEMVSAAEKRQLLVEWNRTEREYPRNSCIHELFEQQAERTPEAIALEFEDEVVSYAELNARANQLAHYLRGQGVSSESLVGVMMERSVEMVVALLGILKAGGAYLPLDAQYPQERLSFMLEDAGVSLLLIQDRFADRLLPDDADHASEPSSSSFALSSSLSAPSSSSARRVISLDRQWAEVASHSSHNLTLSRTGDHLAYVIYTSGSTGLPKASAIPHRAVLRLVSNTDFAAFSPSEVFLQFAPISFDASTLELWGALLNGARLVLFPPTLPSLAELGRFIRERRISTMWLTAGLFHQLVEHELEQLGGVRQLLAGGDVLSLPHVRRVRERWPQLRLINGYGPTENTTFTCCHTIGEQELRAEAVSVPIGRPIANTRVYVLDERMRAVPVGVAGELYAGGDGLARGYLGRVELTAERFVPDPFSERGGERLYRTGDVVRWSREGWIEFLGRRDTQVKVRGYRVELGEVEAVLGQHAEVAQCVVVVRSGASAQTETAGAAATAHAADVSHEAETAHGASAPAVVSSREKQLVAYVVPQPDAQLSGEALRQWIGERLPAYLVPTAYVLLDELPLTANGKVDRAALPDPERAHQLLGGAERSLTPIEELMAGMWEEVLGIEGVGREDNFFALGGHSLAATQVVSRVRATLGVEVAVRAVFEQPTLAAFAAEVERQRFSTTAGERAGDGAAEGAADSVRWGQIVPVRRERGGGLPLSFAQQRLWFLDQLEPGSAAYNIPAAVRLRGQLNVSALERTLVEVVRRHEVLRTRFVVEAGQPVQVVEEEVSFRLEVINLMELAEEEREVEARRLAEVEAERPFDLSVGPLLRATLVRLSAEEQVVLLTMHHIISDGWSTGILIGEVARLYEAYAKGEESPLGELPIQYGDYAVWQREWLQGEVLEGQLGYWRKQLAGAPPVLELPTDHVRPARQTFAGSRESFALAGELADNLKVLSRRQGVTLFMTLLAAFKALLHHYTKQTDIVVGTGVANRNRVETEGLLGFFLNSLALRTKLDGDPAFGELLGRVREMTLEAYAHQDLPFDVLVDALKLERDLNRNPLFQVWFILQNTPKSYLTLPGLTLESADVEPTTSRFDLSVGLTETPEGLGGWIEYKKDLFDKATIKRMITQYEALLRHVVKAPHEKLSELGKIVEEAGKQHRLAGEQEYKKTLHEKLKNIKRKSSSLHFQ